MRISRDELMRLSMMDEDDAFDPADYTLADLDAMEEDLDKFKREYRGFYDDVKTGKIVSEEDW